MAAQTMLIFLPQFHIGDTRAVCHMKASSTAFELIGQSVDHMYSTCGQFGGTCLEQCISTTDSPTFVARVAAQNALTVASGVDGFELSGGVFVFDSAQGSESHVPIRFFSQIASVANLLTFRRNREFLEGAGFSVSKIDDAAKQMKIAADLVLPVIL